MQKRIVCFILTLLTVFYFVPLNTSADESTTSFKFSAENTAFVVSIPTTLQPSEKSKSFSISSSLMNLKPEETVSVNILDGITKDGTVKLFRNNSSKVSYIEMQLQQGDNTLINGTEVGFFKDATGIKNNKPDVSYNIINDTSTIKSGIYSGNVKFKINLNKE